MSKQGNLKDRFARLLLAGLLSLSLLVTGVAPAFADTELPEGEAPAGYTEESEAPATEESPEGEAPEEALPAKESQMPAGYTEESDAPAMQQSQTPAIPADAKSMSEENGFTISLDKSTYAYTGSAITPKVSVRDNNAGKILTEGTDFRVVFSNNVNVGTATAAITGRGSYASYSTPENKNFTIAKESLAHAKISGVKDKTYTGKAITQNPVVTLNGRTLKEGSDYSVSYKKNVKVGTATLIVSGKGTLEGTQTKTFKITSRLAKKIVRSKRNLSFTEKVQKDVNLGAKATPKKAWVSGRKSSMKVEWYAAENKAAINGYIILRKTGKGKVYKQVGKVSKKKTAFVDKSATKKNTDYSYVVVGYKQDGKSIQVGNCSTWASGVLAGSKKTNAIRAKLNVKPLYLQREESFTLKAGLDAKTYKKGSLRWSSDDPAIASVNKKGKVTGRKAGSTTIRCRLASGWDVVCPVTVFKTKKKVTEDGRWIKSGKDRFYASPKGKLYRNKLKKIGKKYYKFGKNGAVVRKSFKFKGNKVTPNSKTGAISQDEYEKARYTKDERASLSEPYVLVDISEQKFWFYRKGKLVFSTDITSGIPPRHNTVLGTFRIYQKTRNTVLRGLNDDGTKYAAFVRYWMPFSGGYGLHDADWRGAFGGNWYLYNGSHGCVNMPIWAAKRLWEEAPVGTKVVVRK